ncbi:hypothetical protein CBF63_05240 [Lactobacillus johnsonii]|uniref:Uncharacterized protein n=1 Tax=Lactobacillus johnsonii TaxID=33959 RepID=A0A9X6RVK6_LACJH|nr:hypothetical protein [Lactobacillus johnsonii]OYS09234.1 hypothetical protein CBF63_05240 [Lactobacillus johnsonii]OYS12026.1 hypothetical protein CBF50_07305 [Lactobacillus johnsonii]
MKITTFIAVQDEISKLTINSNSITAGLDYLKDMALNLEGKKQHEIEQLAGLIAGMKELSAKNDRILDNINILENLGNNHDGN